MQFNWITAFLASTAISGVVAGPLAEVHTRNELAKRDRLHARADSPGSSKSMTPAPLDQLSENEPSGNVNAPSPEQALAADNTFNIFITKNSGGTNDDSSSSGSSDSSSSGSGSSGSGSSGSGSSGSGSGDGKGATTSSLDPNEYYRLWYDFYFYCPLNIGSTECCDQFADTWYCPTPPPTCPDTPLYCFDPECYPPAFGITYNSTDAYVCQPKDDDDDDAPICPCIGPYWWYPPFFWAPLYEPA